MLWVALPAVGVLLAVGTAGAKGLPVESVSVATVQPHAGQPVFVVIRFAPGFKLGDEDAWAAHEIAAFPKARTDREGWPLDRTDAGLPIALHRVSDTVFRGSFAVADPGDYVIVSWSSFYSYEDRGRGIVVTREFPTPLRLHIADAPTAVTGSGATSTLAIGLITAFAVVTLAVVGMWSVRRRASHLRPEQPAVRPVKDRLLVGDAPRRP